MSLDIFKLDGRVALITGGNRGLGFAMAKALAEAGADVVVTSRQECSLCQEHLFYCLVRPPPTPNKERALHPHG
jgi:short subunit dehydrogenase